MGMFVLIKSRTSSKMGCVVSKTSSLGQILEKPRVRSRGNTFSPIIIKLGQNVCLIEILDELEKWVISGQKLGHWVRCSKNLVYTLYATFLV